MLDKIKILNVREVAEMLKIDPQTVSRKANKGEIPAFKIGNQWRFRLKDIEEWINKEIKTNQSTPKSIDQIERDLIPFFSSNRYKIKLAYIFGSYARCKTHSDSDIDIAILLDKTSKFSMDDKSKIVSELMLILGTSKIDLVILNNANPVITYEVIRDGKIVFMNPDFDLINFKANAIQKYQDTKHHRDIRYDYFLKAVGM